MKADMVQWCLTALASVGSAYVCTCFARQMSWVQFPGETDFVVGLFGDHSAS